MITTVEIDLDTMRDSASRRQLRSRIAQTLNVPKKVRFGPSLAVALPEGLFEQPEEAGREHSSKFSSNSGHLEVFR